MSIRSFSRVAKTDRRGFALISVLVLALLFFALMELMLIESTQAMRSASRFRGRVVAHVLAENAAELAAHHFLHGNGKSINQTTIHGTMSATSVRLPGNRFLITASARTSGTASQSATLEIHGHFEGNDVIIDRTRHSQ